MQDLLKPEQSEESSMESPSAAGESSSTLTVGHQRQFLFPAINSLWEERQQSLLLEIKSGSEPLDLAGDGRADSPGHSAKYGSYNVIDLARSKVVDFKLVQVSKYTIHSAYYLWILSIW